MPLSTEDKARLSSEVFSGQVKGSLADLAFANVALRTELAVAQMEIGVLQDELTAANAQIAALQPPKAAD